MVRSSLLLGKSENYKPPLNKFLAFAKEALLSLAGQSKSCRIRAAHVGTIKLGL